MIEIYGTESCTYCKKAIEIAEQYNLMYDYIDATENYESFQEKFPDAKTVPQIIWNKKHIGGYNDFATEVENVIGGYGDGKI